jgi:uncharacterized protein
VLAALIVHLLFAALGLIPEVRPATEDVFGSISLDYKFVLNVVATAIFVALFLVRRSAEQD